MGHDLAIAEEVARMAAEHDGPVPGWVVRTLLVEYDRRGAIEQRARGFLGPRSRAARIILDGF